MPALECELKAFKEKHGHVRVPVNQDNILGAFGGHMSSARRKPDRNEHHRR